jgi:hypothetical protein
MDSMSASDKVDVSSLRDEMMTYSYADESPRESAILGWLSGMAAVFWKE